MLYPLLLVLLHTQTFWALVALADGSALVKVTSLRPLIRTRPGTDALMVSEPVEVAPKLPWVDAAAGPLSERAATMPAMSGIRKWLIMTLSSCGSIQNGGIINGLNITPL